MYMYLCARTYIIPALMYTHVRLYQLMRTRIHVVCIYKCIHLFTNSRSFP